MLHFNIHRSVADNWTPHKTNVGDKVTFSKQSHGRNGVCTKQTHVTELTQTMLSVSILQINYKKQSYSLLVNSIIDD